MLSKPAPVTRRAAIGWMLAAGATGLLAACAPATPAPAPTAVAAPATAKPTATSAPAQAATPAAAAARWGMNPAQAAAWQTIEDAARKEGTLTYYSLGSVPENRVDDLQKAWQQDYPGIKVDYLFVGNAAAVTARVTTEQDSKTYVGDVADLAVRQVLIIPADYFEAFIPPAVTDPSVKWLKDPVADPGHKGIAVTNFAQFFAIWTNTTLVKPDQAPKNLLDVASNPMWKGQIIWRVPWSAGGGNHLYYFAVQQYGRDWVTMMQAQQPVFADDQDAALVQVARGEYAIGLGLTGRQASQFIKDGQPIAAIWPNDFLISVTESHPVLAHAPHPNAAKVFANWLMTERGQTLWRDLGQTPMRADILPTDEWMKGAASVKQIFENFQNADDQAANYAAAMADFKK
jgi:iron(III) transport system substrate-binding protein